MSEIKKQRIQLIAGCVVSALLVASGIALMLACLGIYRAGDRPFTVDSIGAAYRRVAVLLWITVGAVVAAIVLRLALPTQHKPRRAKADHKAILARLKERLPMECDPAVWEEIDAERRLRRLLRIACILLCVVFSWPALRYVCNPAHYGENYNAAVVAACLWMLPALVALLGIRIGYSFAEEYSCRRELAAVKRAMVNGTPRAVTREVKAEPCGRALLILRISLAVVALALLIIGVANGGMADVLYKAINICTECIGLG